MCFWIYKMLADVGGNPIPKLLTRLRRRSSMHRLNVATGFVKCVVTAKVLAHIFLHMELANTKKQ